MYVSEPLALDLFSNQFSCFQFQFALENAKFKPHLSIEKSWYQLIVHSSGLLEDLSLKETTTFSSSAILVSTEDNITKEIPEIKNSTSRRSLQILTSNTCTTWPTFSFQFRCPGYDSSILNILPSVMWTQLEQTSRHQDQPLTSTLCNSLRWNLSWQNTVHVHVLFGLVKFLEY